GQADSERRIQIERAQACARPMAHTAGKSVDRASAGEPSVALPLRARHRRHAERFRPQRPAAHASGVARLAGNRVYESDVECGRRGDEETGRRGDGTTGRRGEYSAIRNPQFAITGLELEAAARDGGSIERLPAIIGAFFNGG